VPAAPVPAAPATAVPAAPAPPHPRRRGPSRATPASRVFFVGVLTSRYPFRPDLKGQKPYKELLMGHDRVRGKWNLLSVLFKEHDRSRGKPKRVRVRGRAAGVRCLSLASAFCCRPGYARRGRPAAAALPSPWPGGGGSAPIDVTRQRT
jgi:hypothetical protein